MAGVARDEKQLGQYIPLHYHFNMLTDIARMQGFKAALEKKVPAGGKVLELGGGTGVLSFFAASRASKVWCVERNPELVQAARYFRTLNPQSAKVEIIAGDALEFLPPIPVDVVVCEMLHSALLREKQIQVIRSFKERYHKKFATLPVFIPEATLLAVQPVQQSFNFCGYYAPVPIFHHPMLEQGNTVEMAAPWVYHTLDYGQDFASHYSCNTKIVIQTPGHLNALKFITKNILAILVPENQTIDWFNQNLIIPVPVPMKVNAGDAIRVRFSYEAGDSLDALIGSLKVKLLK